MEKDKELIQLWVHVYNFGVPKESINIFLTLCAKEGAGWQEVVDCMMSAVRARKEVV